MALAGSAVWTEELHHLSGYDNARPVRIGNGAYNQMQHDIWGSMLDSVYLHARSREQIAETLWPVLKQQVEEAIKHWREPDRGIWEVRGEPQHFTSSKIMCWVALDRGAKLAELHGWTRHHLSNLGMLIDRIGVASHRHVPLTIRGSTVRQRTRERIRKTFGYRRRNTGIGD
jgi:GH15 family glucan-1,4-alpha-glucosidase